MFSMFTVTVIPVPCKSYC